MKLTLGKYNTVKHGEIPKNPQSNVLIISWKKTVSSIYCTLPLMVIGVAK